jgi:hypothetical protein
MVFVALLCLLLSLDQVSCAKRHKVASVPAQGPPSPTCVLSSSPTTVNKGERLTLMAHTDIPGYDSTKVRNEYRWQVSDASGKPVTVSGTGSSLEVSTGTLACGRYPVTATVTAEELTPDCRDCVTTGQTTCTTSFEVTDRPCPGVTCDIRALAPKVDGGRITLSATADGAAAPIFTWSATDGVLSSTTGAEVTLDTADISSRAVTVTVNVGTITTRCDQPCPGASCSIMISVVSSLPTPPPPPPPTLEPVPTQPRSGPREKGAPAGQSRPRQLPPQSIDESTVVREIPGLPWGNIVYNPPDTMTVGESKVIYLLLGPSKSFDELASELSKKVQDDIRRDTIQFANEMEAHLSGSAFSITPVTNEHQAVDGKNGAQWAWEIKANTPGKQQLHLAINVFPKVGDSLRPYTIKTYDQPIAIEVSKVSPLDQVMAFITHNLQWLWGAIIVPVAAALFAWIRNRRKRKQRPVKSRK